MENSISSMAAGRTLLRNISKSSMRRKQNETKKTELLRKTKFDGRHRWIFSRVSDAFGIDVAKIEGYVAFNKCLHMIDSFCEANGPRKLLWYKQVPEGNVADTDPIVLTLGGDAPLHGECIYFLRIEAVDLKEDRMASSVITGRVSGSALLRSLQETLQWVLVPALSNSKSLTRETHLDAPRLKSFVDDMTKFVSMLSGIAGSLHDAVVLKQPKVPLRVDNSPLSYQHAASSPELVRQCEELVDVWTKQIEDVLGESDVVRREADDVGPKAELEHWKARMAKFNSIVEQVKSLPVVKAAIGVLQAARSPRMEAWKDLDSRITDAANEAKDNVKYLYTLERFSEPLYTADPLKIVEVIPGLINAIKMMHAIARYYNTSERMTALFVKITNQMILSCKAYVAAGGDVWEQPRGELVERLKACLTLFKSYQDAFHKTKQELAARPKEKQFDFSEMYIFGKFELFCKRVQKLIDMFNIVEQFSTLENSSIENMEEILMRFHKILNEMKNRHYDLLDHRKLDFEAGYLEFYEKIIDLERLLQEFISASFEQVSSTEDALRLLGQFKRVVLRSSLRAELENKYILIFANYGKELEAVRKLYEKYAADPPIPRDTPPYAGAIAWARQLYRRIDKPMEVFKTHPHILFTPDAKRTIKVYNKLAEALLLFEVMYHEQWLEVAEGVRSGLSATLLIRHPDGHLVVNFDPLIAQVVRESKAMRRMGLEVPDAARIVCAQEEKFKRHYNELHFLLTERERVMSVVDEQFRGLFEPVFREVDRRMEPALTQLTWASLSIDNYLKHVHTSLQRLDELARKANDIGQLRVRAGLKQIASKPLVRLPWGRAWTVEQFQERIETDCINAANVVDTKGQAVEAAVHDLIKLVTSAYPSEEDVENAQAEADALIEAYATENTEAVGNSVERCLVDLIKSIRSDASSALFSISVELHSSEIVLDPALSEIESGVLQLVETLLASTRSVYQWGGREDGKCLYSQVVARPNVRQLKKDLTSALGEMKTKVDEEVAQFSKFQHLYKEDKNLVLEEFFEKNPTIDDFAHQLSEFEASQREISEIPGNKRVTFLNVDFTPVRTALDREATSWKQYFGENLKGKSHRDMQALFTSVEDKTMALNRQVNDLDEVRAVMDVLAEIRENETATEMKITAIEEIYALLNKYKITYSKEEAERADNLRYSYTKLAKVAGAKQEMLISLQPGFRKELSTALVEFDKQVSEFVLEYNAKGPNIPGIKPRVAVERLKTFSRMFEEHQRHLQTYNGGEELFGMTKSEYPELDRIRRELRYLELLYGLYTDVIMTVNGYEDLLWSELNLESIQVEVKDFQDRCKRLPKAMKEWEAFLELKKTIDDFDTLTPLLESMLSRAVQPRHWDEIMRITKHKFKLDPDTFKLKHLLEAPLLKYQDQIHEICYNAKGEADVELKLKSIQDEWATMEFTFATFKNRGELVLNGETTADILAALEESLLSLQTLMSNRNNKPFKADIQLMSTKLNTCLREVENWQHVQSLWIYLEAVFMGGDISKALPQEKKRFTNIDNSWSKIMNSVRENPNVVNFVYGDETLRNLLPHLTEQLELCQSSLTGYLESKQQIFPRFYFLSNPALLEVLGQANSDTHTVKAHLSSVFANIANVRFSQTDYNQIVGMLSAEGEYVQLIKPLDCEGNVEVWLNALINSMRSTVKVIIQRGASAMGSMELEEFCREHHAQVALLGIQLMWTEQCEQSLVEASRGNSTAMKSRDKGNDMIFRKLVNMTREELPPMERVKVETLVTIHLHQVQVFHKLVQRHIKSPDDFEWQKQARFYLNTSEGEVVIRISNTDSRYCYEYLGCTDRLVITPLTDRCYITLAQALAMSLGGAPAGPAGTGKTETVKDMGKALGKYVVVFNCSPEHEYKQMEMIYKGICMSGCWGDFDEFNRIKLPVLSVCAAQIASIFAAKKEKKNKFLYTDGTMVDLDKECGIFITMNPGYAGRQELPENLKLQFRTVAMMVPDRSIIMEVKLASAGFLECSELATKFFWLYKLCEEQLSNQRHYDFGLRNILSVLRTCGKVKRTTAKDDPERIILQRVARDMNLSKLVDDDYSLFLSLIDDLFPNSNINDGQYGELDRAIETVLERKSLVSHPAWKLKVIQLHETAQVRWGIMVLGPSGAGKTACINTLVGALNEMGTVIREVRMNPKAIEPWQYLGKIDPGTNEWRDGVFSALWRKHNGMLKKKKDENVWLTMDGPIDSLWIESLNTVLDDNKTLTLPNGDRLVMADNLKLVFEVDSVRNASPATVSRAGMIYMSGKALGWRPVFQAWLLGRPPNQVEVLTRLFEATWDPLSIFVEESGKAEMAAPLINAISTACTLLSGLLDDPAHSTAPSAFIERAYVFAAMWSLGGLLGEDGREILTNEFNRFEILDLPEDIQENDSLYDYTVSDKGEWVHWKTRVPVFKFPKTGNPPFYSIHVPTVSSVRTEFLVDLVAKQSKSVLLVGESGTAKTVTILKYLSDLDPGAYTSKTINFSSATHPNLYQRTIEGCIQKAHGLTFKPPGQKKMIVFIDDLSMPRINEHGDQPTNEIVRELIEEEGFYSLDKPGEFMNIKDLQFLAAMFHPGGGRNDIPDRLKRHFTIFNCTLPSGPSIETIFSAILTGFYSGERGFPQDVQQLIPRIVPLTRMLWAKTKVKMLPTPAHFHYTFNLRDLSRITEGLVDAQSDVINTPKLLLMLWKHECHRVLADKLINKEDKEWFSSCFASLLAEEVGQQVAHSVVENDTLFVDFLRDEPDAEDLDPDDPSASTEAPKIYEPVKLKDLKTRLEYFLTQYNGVRGQSLDLVLFEDCMKHVAKVARILRRPRGNALLVGVGGSGKQSVTRLAAFIAGHQLVQLSMSRSYSLVNFMDDLLNLYKITGHEGKPVTFIFGDNDVKDQSFLEYMNSVLTSGEVANLVPKDELDNIVMELRPILRQQRPDTEDTYDNAYKFFIERVRTNLHVALCFSPVGEKFRNRALKFPGLINGCTINWFEPWPKNALVAVAEKYLNAVYDAKQLVCTRDVKNAMVQYMCNSHFLVEKTTREYFEKFRRQVFVTPKSYLNFINSYLSVYKSKKDEIDAESVRMNGGLVKLSEASVSVAKMQEELNVKNEKLAVAQVEAAKVLAEIKVSTAAAQKEAEKVKHIKDAVTLKAEQARATAEDANLELEKAMPILHRAIQALEVINPKEINELRVGNNPVHFTQRVLECVRILRYETLEPCVFDPDVGKIRTTWKGSVSMMKQADFLTRLRDFPKERLNAETMELLEPYFKLDSEFTVERARSTNTALAGLFVWIVAMVDYYNVATDIEPKTIAKKRAEKRLETAERELGAAQAVLQEKQAELNAMTERYNEAIANKQRLLDDATHTERTMISATQLIEGLAGEKIRWTAKSKTFEETIKKLVGDVAVATAFVSYAGPFNQQYRQTLVSAWCKDISSSNIPFNANVNVKGLLADDNTIGRWNIEGLPSDGQSVENGIMVTQSSDRMDANFPLLIDPQTQGHAWIIARETANGLVRVTVHKRGFRDILENCVSSGTPLLIEDMDEEMDPLVDKVLDKGVKLPGHRTFMCKVGDKEVPYHTDFRLYMTSKYANPRYPPEVYAKAAVIDFTVTKRGLEDQLLGRVIRAEKEELELQRIGLLQEVNANRKQIKDLEDNLLYRLSNTQGNLVEDADLIQVLRNTKRTSEEVSEKLTIAEETNKKIDAAREEFRPVANRGSVLYFLVSEMSGVNAMYQTSLQQFLEVFDNSIERAPKSHLATTRSSNIIEELTYALYVYIARGLFEADKLLLQIQMALKIDLEAGNITPEEVSVFVKGGASLDPGSVKKTPDDVDLSAWLNLVALSDLPRFHDILNQIYANKDTWLKWVALDRPEDAVLPDGYNDTLDSFRKLLLIRCWCEDRMYYAAKAYIEDALGKKYTQPIPEAIETAFEESTNRVPVVCLLSLGSDPSSNIKALAKRLRLPPPAECSMGQGQEVVANRLLSAAMTSGGWVLLQNCHLGLKFLEDTSVLLKTVPDEGLHEDFRLWVTTEPVDKFPISLLHMAIKVTNEPPQGIMAGLSKTFSTTVTQDLLDRVDRPEWRPLLFSVCFMYSVLQERRKYGPLGWNIAYEFNQSDLYASVTFLSNNLYHSDSRSVDWKTIQYMVCECHYGGRVTDDFDRRLVTTYGKKWLSQDVCATGTPYKFAEGYTMPNARTIKGFHDYITRLDDTDSPEVFGLHPNADIAYRTGQATSLLNAILTIQPKDSALAGGDTREAQVSRQCESLLEQLPDDIMESTLREQIEELKGFKIPLNIFLFQEVQRFQNVVSLVRKDLQDLILAIEGTIILSESLVDVLNALHDGRVPPSWLAISWKSSTLGFWMSALDKRHTQYTEWLKGERPTRFWLAGFFNPQGFLTSVLQEYSRHNEKALDEIMSTTTVLKDKDAQKRPAFGEGVLIYGLTLEGAAWDRRGSKLKELTGKETTCEMPVLHFTGRPRMDVDEDTMYRCPVYVTPRRTDLELIVEVFLGTGNFPPQHWTLRGVALIASVT